MWIARGLLGIVVLLALSWLFSENRRRVQWKVVVWGVGLQFAVALLLTYVPLFQKILLFLNRGVAAVERASHEGGAFVFGYLTGGTDAPFALKEGFAAAPSIFFFGPLMMLIVVGALSAILFYLGIMQKIVGAFAKFLHHTMGLGGAEGVAVAANVFMGQSDAPLLIKPYVNQLDRAGLMCVMTAGMTTISGSLMVVYTTMLDPSMPGLVLGHLVTASLISAPAAVMIARLMVPSVEAADGETPDLGSEHHGVIDALLAGASDGAKVMVNVAIMLVAIIAVVSLINQILAFLPFKEPISLQRMLGWVMAPVMWLIGVPWNEAQLAGRMMSLKTVFNEFVAYMELAKLPADAMSMHSRLITIYALCGFANFSSIGIIVGSLSALAPEKKRMIASLGFKALVAGTIATLCTGAVIGILKP